MTPPDTQATAAHLGPIPHNVYDQPCLDFVNSAFTDHTGTHMRFDRLDSTEWRNWFLQRWSFRCSARISTDTLARLKRLRANVRVALEGRVLPSRHQTESWNRILAASTLVWRLEEGEVSGAGPALAMRLSPVNQNWNAVMAGVVASLCELAVSGDLNKVKRCGNPHCSFLFFDDSANRTRRWCDPAICGNLVRVRAFRNRNRHTRRASTRQVAG